jgi:outer membrane protein
MFLRRILISVLAGSFSICGFAQEKLKLSFKEAVKIGLQNNVLYNQQKNQLEYTQVSKTSSLLAMGPSAQARLDVYRNDGNSFNQQEGRVINGVVDYVGGSVSANMPLLTGLTNLNTFRSANKVNEAQLYKVARSNQDAIATVSNQYLLCLLDQELVKVNQENVRVQKVTYDQINEQAKLGAKAEADSYNQEYLLRNAELALIQTQNQLVNDLSALAVT